MRQLEDEIRGFNGLNVGRITMSAQRFKENLSRPGVGAKRGTSKMLYVVSPARNIMQRNGLTNPLTMGQMTVTLKVVAKILQLKESWKGLHTFYNINAAAAGRWQNVTTSTGGLTRAYSEDLSLILGSSLSLSYFGAEFLKTFDIIFKLCITRAYIRTGTVTRSCVSCQSCLSGGSSSGFVNNHH
jgi:hypothetical protein